MSGHRRSTTTLVALLAMLALPTGCSSSPPSKFYALNALPSSSPGGAAAEETVVAVAPVTIPLYLDRPQIVTRASENELKLSEFDRWAGSLREDLATVVTENLSELLRGQGVTVLRAGAVGQRPATTRYRISVDVMRFEAAADGSVTLKAQWTIIGEEGGKPAFIGESNIQEAVQTSDYAGMVAAMSRAIEKMSREITAILTSKALTRSSS
jgi:uncharacterized lipoprotein YmbA